MGGVEVPSVELDPDWSFGGIFKMILSCGCCPLLYFFLYPSFGWVLGFGFSLDILFTGFLKRASAPSQEIVPFLITFSVDL
jgi:hypothetical protein